MADTAWTVDRLARVESRGEAPRHAGLVRVTHWLTTFCFLALLVSGFEIVISHPRFYWGESGNVLTPALFSLPIPASPQPSRPAMASCCRIRTAGAARSISRRRGCSC
jgi:hypothetical protein